IQTLPHAICGHCNCKMTTHIWGWCADNHRSHCHIRSHESCYEKETGAKVCRDCGCYLVEGIHEIHETVVAGDTIDEVWCDTCNTYCTPDGPEEIQETQGEGDSERKPVIDVKPIDDTDEITELSINSPDDNEQSLAILTLEAKGIL